MNVIRQVKRGGGNPSGSRPFAINTQQKPRGRGRGASDFDLIQYRPGQRVVTSTSSSGEMKTPSSGEMKTPSNLHLQMAISSSARRNSSSLSRDASDNTSSPSAFAFGQSLQWRQNHLKRTMSSSSGMPSSSSNNTPRYSAMGPPKTPRSIPYTPRNSMIVASTPRTTPTSTSTGGDQQTSHVILAVTEGRGHARGEVGIALIDVKRPRLILCQLSDRQTYVNTLTKISVFQPAEILVPHTFVESNQPNKLYNLLEEKFPFVSMTKVQRRLFRDSEGLEKVQYLCLPENSSCQLILKDRFYALAATAALLRYVEFVQNIIFAAHSLKVEYQGAHHGTIIDVKTAKNLELLLNQQSNNASHTLVSTMDHCCTHGGSRLLRASLLHPPCSLPAITSRQDGVQELVENPDIHQKIREVLQQLPDVEQLLTLCMQTPSTIDSNQAMETRVNYVLMLKATMETLPRLATALEKVKSYALSKAKECLQDPRGDLIKGRILHTLNEDVKAPKGGKTATFQRCFAIKSGINDLMDVARKTYCELISDMHDHVLDLGSNHSLPVKMNYSVTKGFHVQIPIQRSHPINKSDLPPLFVQVQQSRSCLTCTTEILIHANERIKEVTTEIMNMSNTLLTVVLNDIRSHISYLYEMCESIAGIDLILSLAQISSSHNYVRPKFGDSLSLKASRHPILESITTCEPIANDIEATSWQSLSIITGPNMSGKSIYIRQVLLLQIMAQVGCYVPAEEASFRITDRIFSHLNFDDSIENNASTLALEMQEMQLILSSITATSLVAIDELCRGTSVEEGTAIAWALCEELSQSSAFVFVTTHFRELTRLACLYPSIKNVHLETIEQEFSDKKNRLVYTHRLLPGVNPVESYGLHLAEGLDMPESILKMATSFASQIRNSSETCLISTQGDEAYTRAAAFHRLKILAEMEDLCAEDLLTVQSELKEALKVAQQQQLESKKNHDAHLLGKQSKKCLSSARPEPQATPIEMQYEANVMQKLCAYSSSDPDTSFSQSWSESTKRRDQESTHCEDSTPLFNFKNSNTHLESASKTDMSSSFDYESARMNQSEIDDLNVSLTSASELGDVSMRSLPDSPASTVSCSSHETWLCETPAQQTSCDPKPKSPVFEFSKFQYNGASEYGEMPPSNYSRSSSRNSSALFHPSHLSNELERYSSRCKIDVDDNESFSSFHSNLSRTPCQMQTQTVDESNSTFFHAHGKENSSQQTPFNFDAESFFHFEKENNPREHFHPTPDKFNKSDDIAHGTKRLNEIEDNDLFSPILGSITSRPFPKKINFNHNFKSGERMICAPPMLIFEKSIALRKKENPCQDDIVMKLTMNNTGSTKNLEKALSLQEMSTPNKGSESVASPVRKEEHSNISSGNSKECIPNGSLHSLQAIMESYGYSDSDSN